MKKVYNIGAKYELNQSIKVRRPVTDQKCLVLKIGNSNYLSSEK